MIKKIKTLMALLGGFVLCFSPAFASEADLLVPSIKTESHSIICCY